MKSLQINLRPFLKDTILGLTDLAWPNLCLLCKNPLVEGESCICYQCLYELPAVQYDSFKENASAERLFGRIPFEKAASTFRYQKESNMQKLLEQLKYKGEKQVGEILGKVAANRLQAKGFFLNIDYLIPVPLHPQRFRQRGYNQSEWIAKGLFSTSGIPIRTDVINRKRHNPSQTTRSLWDRWANTQDLFTLQNSSDLAGKHLLLVDDVLTSGSTLEACGGVLLQIPDVRLSLFTVAIA